MYELMPGSKWYPLKAILSDPSFKEAMSDSQRYHLSCYIINNLYDIVISSLLSVQI